MTNRVLGVFSVGVALICMTVPAFAGLTAVTPEPTTVLLIGGGLGAIIVARQLRARKKK